MSDKAPTAPAPEAGQLLEAVPGPIIPEQPAAATDAKPARKSRSGTSGAERRRRAREAAGAAAPAGTAGKDKAPRKTRTPAKPATATEVRATAAAIDKLLPYLALRDPYAAAVIRRRRLEVAEAVHAVPLLRDLVRMLSSANNLGSNPYVVLATVALPILAHHKKLPAPLALPYGFASAVMNLEPSAQEIAKVQEEGAAALMGLMNLGDVLTEAGAGVPVDVEPAA